MPLSVTASEGKTGEDLTRLADGVFEVEHRDAAGAVAGSTTVVLGERLVVVVESCFGTPGVREDVIRIQARGDDPLDLVVDTGPRRAGSSGPSGKRVHLDAHSGMRIVSRVDSRKPDPADAFERLRSGIVAPFFRSMVEDLRSRLGHARARASMAL